MGSKRIGRFFGGIAIASGTLAAYLWFSDGHYLIGGCMVILVILNFCLLCAD